ncbi:MAG: TRAM domain-containing protein, partial [Burkholderiales bacterium]
MAVAPSIAKIESLDFEGRGVTHVDGKVVFVEGALPGERVEFEAFRRKPKYEMAATTSVLEASAFRTQPRCASFGVCGGCSMQHIEARAQVAAKQRVLEDNLTHIGQVRPETILAPIHGPTWGYRYRARFSSRYVRKRETALVGFRERRHSFVADMPACDVVPQRISALLMPLRSLVNSLSIRESVPQIELAIGADSDGLAFRILDPLSGEDEQRLREFADRFDVHIYLQTGGPKTVRRFHPPGEELFSYTLPDFDLEYRFAMTDFTQVNHQINRVLVRRAMSLLDPREGDRVADLFCGIGNFSLPIARSGAQVFGIEGSAALVERARANARYNGLEV